MKKRPIHENLDTSFVNLSALIKYLRRRQFIGSVKIQLNGYNADIELQEDNQMKVSEHDQISGRVSTGEEALQRLLIRAREPGGTINVYQFIEEKSKTPVQKSVKEKTQTAQAKAEAEPIIEAKIVEPIPEKPKPIQQKTPVQNGKPKLPAVKKMVSKAKPKVEKNPLQKSEIQSPEKKIPKPAPVKRETSLPDFPFRLTNQVEEKARQHQISTEDWQMLLKLMVELLLVVDRSLAEESLDFTAAFQKVCAEIADDYPFLNPSEEIFEYSDGKIRMTEKINAKIFVASITEALRKILYRLESNPKFTDVHRSTSQRILALMNKRKPHYDKFTITPQIKRILGV